MSQRQIQQLLQAARRVRTHAIIMLLYGTGMRVAELQALRARDIDPERGIIRVVCGKGGKDRHVMLGQRLLQALRTYWIAARRRDRSRDGHIIVNAGARARSVEQGSRA